MDVLSCAQVEERDLEARYVAGTLPADEAEAFASHFFGCERCWDAVQRALEVRAALGRPAALRQRRVPWWPLAAAAAAAGLAVGVWQFGVSRSESATVLRGRTDTVLVSPGAGSGTLTATWSRVTVAAGYRVRLFTVDGMVLADREVTDTSIAVSTASLRRRFTEAYWEVEALDRLRNVIATSGLRRAVLGAPAP